MTDALTTTPTEPERDPSVAVILRDAIQRGDLSVEALEKITALYERFEAKKAERAFCEAMSHFQATCPPVPNSRDVSYPTKAGGKMEYSYAELDAMAKHVQPYLSPHGLSYSWDSVLSDDGKMFTVTCTVRHSNGHARASMFRCPVTYSDKISAAQSVKQALTFAERCSLSQVLGLTTTGSDTDGANPEEPGPAPLVTPAQVEEIERAMASVNADRVKFLAWMNVARVDDILATDYQRVMRALNAKGKKA